MAVKMRNNNDKDAFCCECGKGQDESLNMFDLRVGDVVLTICDVCNEQILNKCLKAQVMKNERVKSQRDMAIIRKRKNKNGFLFGGTTK